MVTKVLGGMVLEGAGGDGGDLDLWSAQGACEAGVSWAQAVTMWRVYLRFYATLHSSALLCAYWQEGRRPVAAWFLPETLADHHGGLRVVVIPAGQDDLEDGGGLNAGHKLARIVGEHLGHLYLVLFPGRVQSEGSDDVLGGLVILQPP